MKKKQVLALAAVIATTVGVLGSTGSFTTEVTESAIVTAEADGILYEDAIEELYAKSSELTDEEIFSIAEKMVPDMSAVKSAYDAEDTAAIETALALYGKEKSAYILGKATGTEVSKEAGQKASTDATEFAVTEDIKEEWDKQFKYTALSITPDQTLTKLLSGINILSCEADGNRATIALDEWMTEGYTQGSDVVNASAYRYYSTVTMEKQDDTWYVVSVDDTDRNFTWTQDLDEQLAEYGYEFDDEATAQDEQSLTAATAQNEQSLTAAGEQAGAAGEQAAQAGVADADGAMATSNLTLYGANTYTYNVDAAVAYADKWATSRNPQYKAYPGVDCSNFVSQCLYAGGMPKNSKWYPASYAWINVSGAIANFKNYGTFMAANNNNVLKGNPVYYDWNSNGVYDHTAICVGKNSSGTPIIDAHTGDHYHVTWQLGSNGKRATIQLRGNGTSTGTSAVEGSWKKEGSNWFYYTTSGTKMTGWLQNGGGWYYLGTDGKMCTGWKKVGSNWYYFDANGKMKTGWATVNGKSYFFTSGGAMKTGWLKDDGEWYYFATDGSALKGWQTLSDKTYYFDKDGAMETVLAKIDGNLYYFGGSGAMTYGWQTIDGKKYFFSTSAKGQAAVGQWRVGGKVYTFSNEGVLIQ